MSSTYEITGLQYTYGNATLSADYVANSICRITGLQHTYVSNPEDSLCWLALPRESLGYTTLVGAPPQVEAMLVTSSLRIAEFEITQPFPAFRAAYAG